jgi:ABC-type branched-subunit amino acid transport system ATPase component
MLTIETVNLSRKFGDLVAVDHVNLKVEEGELFGISWMIIPIMFISVQMFGE